MSLGRGLGCLGVLGGGLVNLVDGDGYEGMVDGIELGIFVVL